MLCIDGFAYRDELADIISRWTVGRRVEGDLYRLKWIVNFNSYVARIWVDKLARELVEELHGSQPEVRRVCTKAELKSFVVDHPSTLGRRVEKLRRHYGRFPEDFYGDTPVDGTLLTLGEGADERLVASTRIKRFRRIAEKGSRRIVDFLLERVRSNADALAATRALALGIPKDQLHTDPAQMVSEFARAERRVIASIKRGTIAPELPVLAIPDAVGIKVIVEDHERGRLVRVLASCSDHKIVEIEEHHGAYEALNIRLTHRLPHALLASCPPRGEYARVLEYRGFDPAELDREFARFIAGADREVGVEVIVSSFQELLESEIGRSMHEERVISQRSNPDYHGHLASNVRYLMLYLFELCRAPNAGDDVDVPIKLWARYMPETMERVVRQLYRPDEPSFDMLNEQPCWGCGPKA